MVISYQLFVIGFKGMKSIDISAQSLRYKIRVSSTTNNN